MAVMVLPPQVNKALRLLQDAGYEACVVGGYIRDLVMGRQPEDADIATNALPPDTERVFADFRLIETGLKHGTVTALVDGMPIEITTWRVDGEYRDHRRPDSVSFTADLREDLARRDFTMNALAWDGRGDIVDPFGGRADIKKKLIRCVGDPALRFREDALRILRALRFSSVLGFRLEAATAAAARENRELLREISAERISAELRKLLCGQNVRPIILDYTDILGVPLPELLPMKGFEQNNPHHIYDALKHTALVVQHIEARPHLRTAALLHDIAKPLCYSRDDKGVGHFYGHGSLGAEMAENILKRLKLDNATKERVVQLIRYHDANIGEDPPSVKRWLRRLTPETFFDLLALKRADDLGQNPDYADRRAHYDKLEAMAKQILTEQTCLSLKDLAVNGHDLAALGAAPGKALGELLDQLLEGVTDGRLENRAETLKAEAAKLLGKPAPPPDAFSS